MACHSIWGHFKKGAITYAKGAVDRTIKTYFFGIQLR
jgi:hypothetical protein